MFLQIPLFLVHFGLYANIIILDVFLVFLSSPITLCLWDLCILMCITSKSVFIAVQLSIIWKSHNVSISYLWTYGLFSFLSFCKLLCSELSHSYPLMPIHESFSTLSVEAILYTMPPNQGTFDNVWKHFWLSWLRMCSWRLVSRGQRQC